MRSPPVSPGRLIVAIIFGAYPFVMHATYVWSMSSATGRLLLWAELIVLAAIFILKFRRWRFVTIPAAILGAIILAVRGTASDAIIVASGVPFTIAYVGLIFLFGSSLLPGRTPVVSLLSERLGIVPLTPSILRYTRNVTILWSSFFAAQLTVCFVLYFTAPIAVWSFFVNVLNIPLNLAVFISEYSWRRLYYPTFRHRSFTDIVQALAHQNFFDQRTLRSESNSP